MRRSTQGFVCYQNFLELHVFTFIIESITEIHTARMEWKNYERKIICGYGVQLTGWPSHLLIVNGIDNLPEAVLRDIDAKLQSRTIDWSTATEEEMEKVRKALPDAPQRSDKGVARKPYSKRASRAKRNSVSEGGDSSSNNNSNNDSSDSDSDDNGDSDSDSNSENQVGGDSDSDSD